jgi:transketolase
MYKNNLIKKILELSYNKKEGHIGSSLSILDILYNLYENKISKSNDKFILSKGHASLGLYVVLNHFNMLEVNINTFCDFDSDIGGHPSSNLKNVEASTGSLGHGLPIGVGMAMANRINQSDNRVYVLIGDGEANEGSVWEAALVASHHKLNNLVCIMDHNHSGDRALMIDGVIKKFEAFNWHCIEIDGHNQDEIISAINLITDNKPIFILAHTIKGCGIKLMENNPEWHHKSPSEEEYKTFLKEI